MCVGEGFDAAYWEERELAKEPAMRKKRFPLRAGGAWRAQLSKPGSVPKGRYCIRATPKYFQLPSKTDVIANPGWSILVSSTPYEDPRLTT